jgi:hypothetical protein
MGDLFTNPLFNVGLGMLANRQNPAGGALQGMQFHQGMLQQQQQMATQKQRQQLIQMQMMKAMEAQEQAKKQAQARQQVAGMLAPQEELAGPVRSPQAQGQMLRPNPAAMSQLQTAFTAAPGLMPAMLQQRLAPKPIKPTSAMQNYAYGQQQPGFAQREMALKQAGRPIQSVTLKGQGAFAKGLGQKEAENLMAHKTRAGDAVKMLQSNNDAIRLLNDGMATGAFADWMVGLGKVAQSLGFNEGKDPVDNAQAYGAASAARVAGIIKQFGAGTGLSDADRDYAEKAAAGRITMTEGAIRKILAINTKAAKFMISSYNEKAKHIDPKTVPYPLTIEMPEALEAIKGAAEPPAGSSRVIDWEDL